MAAMRTVATNSISGIRRQAGLVIALLLCLTAPPALGSDHGASSHGASGHGNAGGGHGAEAAAYDPTLPRTFDIGDIYIRNFRPTHNEIANIRFTLHVVFAPGTSDKVMAELEHWRRRLRDQAITAARSADPEDLAEPGLTRVQRMMLLRIRRLPLPQPVTGIYLTDFAVGSG